MSHCDLNMQNQQMPDSQPLYCYEHPNVSGYCTILYSVSYEQWHTEGVWGVQTPPPPKFRSFDKAEPNSQFCGKYIHNNLMQIRVSLIQKLSGTPD
jgi:hypothetical protein